MRLKTLMDWKDVVVDKRLFAILASVMCAWFGWSLLKRIEKSKVQKKVRERRERSRRSLQNLRQQLENEKVDLEITELSFRQLQESLQNGALKAVDVLNAYLVKALQVHDSTNAITDYVEVARAEAEALDRLPASERGLLHGIPISLKESLGLKGLDCCAGMESLINKPMPRDALMIQVYKSQGAVPFIRTNTSQACRNFGCDNPIFGHTNHSLTKDRCPGGSSGGEGAMISGGGSILGIGSDLAGSVRIPAAHSGLWSFKPTAERISAVGNFGRGLRIGGQKVLSGADGPLARDAYTLVEYMRASLCPKLYEMDPYVPPLPFREELYENRRPLRIGYFTYDRSVRCVPAVVRGVHLVKETLQDLGHTMVEVNFPDGLYCLNNIMWPALFGDDSESFAPLVQHDDKHHFLYNFVMEQTRPYFIRWLQAKWISLTGIQNRAAVCIKIAVQRAFAAYQALYAIADCTALLMQRTAQPHRADPTNEGLIGRRPTRSTRQWWDLNLDHKVFAGEFEKSWKNLELDLLICPTMPCPALGYGVFREMMGALSYTAIYSAVNYPAGSLPATHVTADDVKKTFDPEYYPADTYVEKLLRKDSVNSEGLPVGVQVAGLPFQEELVLRIMSDLDEALPFRNEPSFNNYNNKNENNSSSRLGSNSSIASEEVDA